MASMTEAGYFKQCSLLVGNMSGHEVFLTCKSGAVIVVPHAKQCVIENIYPIM